MNCLLEQATKETDMLKLGRLNIRDHMLLGCDLFYPVLEFVVI